MWGLCLLGEKNHHLQIYWNVSLLCSPQSWTLAFIWSHTHHSYCTGCTGYHKNNINKWCTFGNVCKAVRMAKWKSSQGSQVGGEEPRKHLWKNTSEKTKIEWLIMIFSQKNMYWFWTRVNPSKMREKRITLVTWVCGLLYIAYTVGHTNWLN